MKILFRNEIVITPNRREYAYEDYDLMKYKSVYFYGGAGKGACFKTFAAEAVSNVVGSTTTIRLGRF